VLLAEVRFLGHRLHALPFRLKANVFAFLSVGSYVVAYPRVAGNTEGFDLSW